MLARLLLKSGLKRVKKIRAEPKERDRTRRGCLSLSNCPLSIGLGRLAASGAERVHDYCMPPISPIRQQGGIDEMGQIRLCAPTSHFGCRCKAVHSDNASNRCAEVLAPAGRNAWAATTGAWWPWAGGWGTDLSRAVCAIRFILPAAQRSPQFRSARLHGQAFEFPAWCWRAVPPCSRTYRGFRGRSEVGRGCP
jgi:hypothetical protein